MKNIKYLLLMFLYAGNAFPQIKAPTITLHKKELDKSSLFESKSVQNSLYGTVLVGAMLSFVFWLPETSRVIEVYGFGGAILSTHIPRISIDLLTIAACINGLYQTNKNDNSNCLTDKSCCQNNTGNGKSN